MKRKEEVALARFFNKLAKGMLGKEARRIVKLLDTRAVGEMDNVARGGLEHVSVCSSVGNSVVGVTLEEDFEKPHVEEIVHDMLACESTMNSVSEETITAPVVEDIGSGNCRPSI